MDSEKPCPNLTDENAKAVTAENDAKIADDAAECRERVSVEESETTPQPRFRVKTQYTLDRLMDLNILHFFDKKWPIILVSVCAGIVTLTTLFDIAMFGELSFEMGLCFCLMLALVALSIAWVFIIPRFTYKKMIGYLAVNTVDFYENMLVAVSEGEELSGRTECSYTSIVKVRESKDNLFLFLSPNQAFIISKADVEGGDYEALIAHIRKRCDYKAFGGYRRVI